MPGDRLVDIGGRCFAPWQRERCVGRAHQDVDLVDVQGVAMLFAEAERPRVRVGDLDDEQTRGIGARAV